VKEKLNKLTLYVPLDLVRRLKAHLTLRGKSVSEWFREKAQEEIDQ